jgi:NAD(P)-dependent dehydrogenase (short-subunit alcohol dehydrogenase family)
LRSLASLAAENRVTSRAMSKTAIVTGASRGLGRGVAEALVARKMRVVGVARGAAALEKTAKEVGFLPVAGDAADDALAGTLLAEHEPDVLVLGAGASPPLRALHLHTWESFSHNWHVDTKATFACRPRVRRPLRDRRRGSDGA